MPDYTLRHQPVHRDLALAWWGTGLAISLIIKERPAAETAKAADAYVHAQLTLANSRGAEN